MQGTVEATGEEALAAGGPPGGPHGLAVQGVGLQAAPRVHSVPHLRSKHTTVIRNGGLEFRGSAQPSARRKRPCNGTRFPLIYCQNKIQM